MGGGVCEDLKWLVMYWYPSNMLLPGASKRVHPPITSWSVFLRFDHDPAVKPARFFTRHLSRDEAVRKARIAFGIEVHKKSLACLGVMTFAVRSLFHRLTYTHLSTRERRAYRMSAEGVTFYPITRDHGDVAGYRQRKVALITGITGQDGSYLYVSTDHRLFKASAPYDGGCEC